MEAEKPFVCKAEGCEMRFTNEDHLTVHTKKHAMVLHLSLNNKDSKAAANFLADQTPTPTRLIKNCDEVGLFEDLQHVNPFDETFRRAVESKSTDDTVPHLLPGDTLGEDETLNTPHVLPFTELANNKTVNLRKKIKTSTKLIKVTKNPDEKVVSQHSTVENIQSKVPITLETKSNPEDPLPEHSSLIYHIRQLPLDPIKYPKIQPKIIAPTKLIQLEVINSSQRNNNSGSVLIIPKSTPPSDTYNTPLSTIRARIKETLKKNSQKLLSRKQKKQKEDLTTKTKLKFDKLKGPSFAERNKAAAMRYRNKIKTLHKDIQQQNKSLLAENESLKAELSQLRIVMLAHRECSVSKAMAMGQNIPIGLPKLIVKDTSKSNDNSQPIYFLVNNFTKN